MFLIWTSLHASHPSPRKYVFIFTYLQSNRWNAYRVTHTNMDGATHINQCHALPQHLRPASHIPSRTHTCRDMRNRTRCGTVLDAEPHPMRNHLWRTGQLWSGIIKCYGSYWGLLSTNKGYLIHKCAWSPAHRLYSLPSVRISIPSIPCAWLACVVTSDVVKLWRTEIFEWTYRTLQAHHNSHQIIVYT